METTRIGSVLRSVRIRQRLRQEDVAVRAGVSRATVGRAERGHIRTLTVRAVLGIADALGVHLDVAPRWRGGDLGRVLNEGHSAMHEQLAAMFAGRAGWLAQPEVSFAIYGERGVIDILAFHPITRALLVVELKADVVEVNDLMGTVDRYIRLARRIAAERGWRASTVSGWLVIRDTMTNRRRVAAHAQVLRAAFPADGRHMRAWLRRPGSSSIRALSFLSDDHRGSTRESGRGIRRVRPRRMPDSTLTERPAEADRP